MAKKTTKILTKADLLTSNLKSDYCELPELGGKVLVRSLSGKSLLAYNERIKALGSNAEIDGEASMKLMAYMISLTVIAQDGSLMFTEDEAYQLADGNLSVMLTLAEKAMELSGVSTVAIAEVKDKLKNGMTSSSTAN